MMKLHIFTIKKFQGWANQTCLAVIDLDSALKKTTIFLHKCFQKSVNTLRHINDNLSDFSSSFSNDNDKPEEK